MKLQLVGPATSRTDVRGVAPVVSSLEGTR